MKCPVPDEAQAEILRRNGIDPEGVFIRCADGVRMELQNYKTGDEITVRAGIKSQRLGSFAGAAKRTGGMT